MKEKIFTLLLTLMATATMWAQTMPLGGEGTAESPYLLTSAEDWNALTEYMVANTDSLTGKFLQVEQDIDFTDKELHPLLGIPFNGTLLGNGKTFSGINYTTTAAVQGLIGRTWQKSVIRDLTLAGELNSSFNYTAAFCGQAHANSQFINCTNQMNITGTGNYVAGIANSGKFESCKNEGNITGKSYVAGISNESSSIVNCENDGSIYASGSTSGGYAGGITNCMNSVSYQIVGCVNHGDVYGGGRKSYVGGIAGAALGKETSGYIDWLDDYGSTYDKIFITNCYNEGTISAARDYVGGIVGKSTGLLTMTGCVNSGTVDTENGVCVGGIIGEMPAGDCTSGVVILRNCTNLGNVTAKGREGGIVGYALLSSPASGLIENCINAGTITSGSGEAGGIAGTLRVVTFNNCLNVGMVASSSGTVGGILSFDDNSCRFNNCLNTGTLNSESGGIGGIVGQSTRGTIMTKCIQDGVIEAGSEIVSYGNMIGYMAAPNTVTATNCYYAAENGLDEGVDSARVTALPLAELCQLDMGDNWVSFDDYSLPMPTSISENDIARVAAAEVILADDDTRQNVTQDFHVGVPEGCTWTSSLPVVAIDGNDATLVEPNGETVTLTVAAGEFSKEITLILGSGVAPLRGDINGDNNVDVADVNIIINIMLGKAQASDYPGNADLNNDNNIDVSDVNIIINIMLGKE